MSSPMRNRSMGALGPCGPSGSSEPKPRLPMSRRCLPTLAIDARANPRSSTKRKALPATGRPWQGGPVREWMSLCSRVRGILVVEVVASESEADADDCGDQRQYNDNHDE